jgi:acetyl-CoA carboxylase biotin carboxyl carrier protein
MKAKEIQELIDFIAKSGLEEVNIETEQFKLKVKRNSPTQYKYPESVPQPVVPVVIPSAAAAVPQPPSVQTSAVLPAAAAAPSAGTESQYVTIKSPMIGTFYRSSNPDAPVFVNIGDDVKKGQTVCIIEAMKLFNEIESEVSGRIIKILVENASPVEYDQPLFLVDPS